MMSHNPTHSTRHTGRRPRVAMLAALLALTAACGGSLYKVKPVVDAPVVDGAPGSTVGGVQLRAMPILVDEEIQELFEANLLLAGLLPVRVEMSNAGTSPVDLKKARFRVRDTAGREWKARTPKQAVSRIMDAYEVYLYNPNSRAQFIEEFSRHALQTQTPLAQGERRTGLIFFQTPDKRPVENPQGLTLTIEKLPQPLELRLN